MEFKIVHQLCPRKAVSHGGERGVGVRRLIGTSDTLAHPLQNRQSATTTTRTRLREQLHARFTHALARPRVAHRALAWESIEKPLNPLAKHQANILLL